MKNSCWVQKEFMWVPVCSYFPYGRQLKHGVLQKLCHIPGTNTSHCTFTFVPYMSKAHPQHLADSRRGDLKKASKKHKKVTWRQKCACFKSIKKWRFHKKCVFFKKAHITQVTFRHLFFHIAILIEKGMRLALCLSPQAQQNFTPRCAFCPWQPWFVPVEQLYNMRTQICPFALAVPLYAKQ